MKLLPKRHLRQN